MGARGDAVAKPATENGKSKMGNHGKWFGVSSIPHVAGTLYDSPASDAVASAAGNWGKDSGGKEGPDIVSISSK